ncbi:hypothetical protein CFP56_001341 [Quercus suber]|uniref:PGG domain-containing protein n=1 Tax=Quercus suber TaxID=58331 RepID=A0AAW0LH90_QUESU
MATVITTVTFQQAASPPGGGRDIVDRYNTLAKTTQSRKKWWKNLLKHLNYEENRGYIMVMATVITTITFQQAVSPQGRPFTNSIVEILETIAFKNNTIKEEMVEEFVETLEIQSNCVEENHGCIMVMATVITTITFQQAASPPSGVWLQSGNDTHYFGYNIEVDAGMSVVDSIDPLYYFYFMIFNTISFIASVIVTFLLIIGFPFKNKICMGLLTITLCTTLAFLVITYITAISMLTSFSIRFEI